MISISGMFMWLPNYILPANQNPIWHESTKSESQNKIFYESAEIFPVLMPRNFLWPQRSKCVGPPPLLRQNKCDKCGKTARRNKNLERHRQMCTAHLGRPTLCAAQCTKLQNSKRQKYWFGFPHLWGPTKSWCQINGAEYWSGWQIPSFNHNTLANQSWHDNSLYVHSICA